MRSRYARGVDVEGCFVVDRGVKVELEGDEGRIFGGEDCERSACVTTIKG